MTNTTAAGANSSFIADAYNTMANTLQSATNATMNTVHSATHYQPLSQASDTLTSYPGAAFDGACDALNSFAQAMTDNVVTRGVSDFANKTVNFAKEGFTGTRNFVGSNLLPALVAGGCAAGAYRLGTEGYNEIQNGESKTGAAKMAGAVALGTISAVVISGSPAVTVPMGAVSNYWNS